MAAITDGCELTHTNCSTWSGSGCNTITSLEAIGIDANTGKSGKITFEQPKPNPSSKEGKRLKRSGKPF